MMWKCVAYMLIFFLWKFASTAYAQENVLGGPKPVTCGQNLTTPTGSFRLAVANLSEGECYWYIVPKGVNDTKINIFIHHLFLHANDVLTLYRNGSLNETSLLVPPIYAQNGSITILTEEKIVVMKLTGNDISFLRKFEGFYQSQNCAFPITNDLEVIHSPIHSNLNSTSATCSYTYNRDTHHRSTPAFVFELFNYTNSKVELKGSTLNGPYNDHPAIEFFPDGIGQTLTIEVDLAVGSPEYFRLKMHFVDSSCSRFMDIKNSDAIQLISPTDMLDNGTLVYECHWVIKHSDPSKILGIVFDKLHFADVLDIVAINDGPNEFAQPLLQIVTSNSNITKRQMIRTTGQYMWVAFKPVTYSSSFSANVTIHGQGGYHKGSGNIKMIPTVGNDTVFLLEVEDNEVVLLNITQSSFPKPASLSIYNSFDTSDLLATLHGDVWYPVLSRSSRMMIIATNFAAGSFVAEFSGISPGCLHMSTLSTENYILSGNCNNTCIWVIPPQDQPGLVLLLDIQYISLEKEDQIGIMQLDEKRTHLGAITADMTHVPQVSIQADIGALVEVVRGTCKKSTDVILIGHSSYVPACVKKLSFNVSEVFQVTSPLHPDTYPVLASCRWTISTSKENLIHLTFQNLKLALNHCVRIIESSANKTFEYAGNQLPDDLLLTGESVIEFDSSNCGKPNVTQTLVSAEGFVLNGTIADCGASFDGKTSGEFNSSLSGSKTLCIWIVTVPATSGKDVNIISFTVNKKDSKENYDLHVYDGASMRESEIKNITGEVWSRTNTLIFVFKRLDVSKPSSVLVFKYSTKSCNSTMQCENKICLHPEWRCNGINECGDFSDERNCASIPVPPETKLTGYSELAFWLTVMFMLVIGIILGMAVPHFYQKYKNGQYRRFGDISVIE